MVLPYNVSSDSAAPELIQKAKPIATSDGVNDLILCEEVFILDGCRINLAGMLFFVNGEEAVV